MADPVVTGVVEVEVTIYERACACMASATTRQWFVRETIVGVTGVIFTLTFHEGLVCDACGIPWHVYYPPSR
jgi:hypothetical protein